MLTDSSALDLARELTDYTAAPISTMLGEIRMDRAPMPADVIRACRRAARDHAARDPYAVPLPDVALMYEHDGYGAYAESIDRSARALERMREVRERREMRESGYGLESARPLPWRACRVVGCMAPDPEVRRERAIRRGRALRRARRTRVLRRGPRDLRSELLLGLTLCGASHTRLRILRRSA